jgi:hypothetical protein
VATILKQGSIPEEWLQTAMEMALESEHHGIIRILQNKQEEPFQEDKEKQSEEQLVESLLLACEEGNTEGVAAILKQGTISTEVHIHNGNST